MKNVKVPTEEKRPVQGVSGANRGIYRVTIPGRMPSLNEYIEAERRNRYVAAQMKSEKQFYAGLHIRKCLPGVHIDVPVYIHYHWYEPNKRRDKSNACAFGRKVIEDALVQQHVLRDDGWDEIAGFRDHFAVDKNNPRIEVEIIPCRNGDDTTSDAGITTGETALVSPASTTATDTAATSGAAQGTDGAVSKWGKGARTTRRKRGR